MKKEQLFEAFQSVEDELLERSEKATSSNTKGIRIHRWMAVAAGIVLLLIAGTTTWIMRTSREKAGPSKGNAVVKATNQVIVTPSSVSPASPSPETAEPTAEPSLEPSAELGPDNLPMLMVADYVTMGQGDGGILAYDCTKLQSGNPWTEKSKIETMPVYRNPSYMQVSGKPIATLTDEQLMKLANQVATALGEKIDTTYYRRFRDYYGSVRDSKNDTYNPIAPYSLECSSENIHIQVDAHGTVVVNFDEPVELPQQYCLNYYDVESKQATNTVEYLLNQYKALIPFALPKVAISTQYNYDGKVSLEYQAYEHSTDSLQSIVNYNFSKVKFTPNEQGRLATITLYNGLLGAKKIGDYSIISSKAALQLLLKGKFQTTMFDVKPTKENVSDVTLEYRQGVMDQVLMPYYRFLVETPEKQEIEGLHSYGIYYVPAVESKYLTYLPKSEITFN